MNESVVSFPSKENLRQRGAASSSSAAAAAAAEAPPPPHRGVRFVPEDVAASPLESVLGVVTAVLATWCAAGLMTILVVLYVTVRPFSKATYRRLAAAWGGAAFLDALTLLVPNCRICLTGDSDVPSPVGSSVLVANHVVAADWWAVFLLGRCVGLRGSLKAFLRNEFLHINMVNVEIAANSMQTNGNGSSASLIAAAVAGASNGSHATTQGTTSAAVAAGGSSTNGDTCKKAAPDLALMAKLLHLFMEFPLINGDDCASDREHLFTLLRSFAAPDTGSPVHLLFYPECWALHSGEKRRSVHAKSNEFAKREGKSSLKHLLLPRTRGFNASLECLRESSPVVYDVTMVRSRATSRLASTLRLLIGLSWYRCPCSPLVLLLRYRCDLPLGSAGLQWLRRLVTSRD